MRAQLLRPEEVEAVPVLGGEMRWHPLRRTLGLTGFGINAYSGDAGARVVEEHDEQAGHQELYVVLHGRATFRSDEDRFEAAQGSVVFYPDADIVRGAVAEEDGTVVLAIGGNAGAPYEPAAWEHWFLAEPHTDSGDHEKAATLLAAGLSEHPEHPRLLLHLACAESRAGRHDDALATLGRALDADRAEIAPRAAAEPGLEPLRSRPDWPL